MILNYETAPLTEACAKQIADICPQSYIVIVDNLSRDESFSYLSSCFSCFEKVFVIESEKNGGYSYGNNCGVKFLLSKTSVEFIGIVNPDVCFPDSRIFESLVSKLIAQKHLAAITGLMISGNSIVPRLISWKLPKGIDDFFTNSAILRRLYDPLLVKKYEVLDENTLYVDTVPGSFFIIRSSVLQKVGFFDENLFLYYEENSLFSLTRKLGYKVGLSTCTSFFHKHDYSTMELKKEWCHFAYFCKSQKHYTVTYLENGKLLYPLLLVTALMHMVIEIPLKYILRKLMKCLRKRMGCYDTRRQRKE